jgi:hypothetical protein
VALVRVRRVSICVAGAGVGACGACPVSPCLMMLAGCVLRMPG